MTKIKALKKFMLKPCLKLISFNCGTNVIAIKSIPGKGAWVAESVEPLTLGFISDCHLRVLRSSPTALTWRLLHFLSLSICPSCSCSLSP